MPTPRIFFSAGEPSGDLHGASLIQALRRVNPGVVCEGFGGEHMAEVGFNLHYSLCQHPLIGFLRVASHIRQFARLLNQATEHFKEHRPDAVVLIDYPGFNWWVARRAHALGIPVVYFIPPQIWGWASWRVRKMRRYVDHVLCTLPFEQSWYKDRGIDAPYIGHPYFDALHERPLDQEFIAAQRQQAGTVVGILPGSRNQEIENNLETQLRAAELIHRRRPETRFLVACFKPEHADRAAHLLQDHYPAPEQSPQGSLATGVRGAWSLPVELCVGRTPEVIHLAHSCLSVSGSVSLELLYERKPAVICYHSSLVGYCAYQLLCNVKYITLVNLLADRPLYPEIVAVRRRPELLAEPILNWLDDPVEHQRLRDQLGALREEVAVPGACDRAAGYILSALSKCEPLAA